MTVYGTSSYPVSNDWSFDTRSLLYFFSPKYKSFQLKNVSNKYLFSYNNDFFCVQKIRSKYRVIGRFVSDFDFISFCPNYVLGTDFDTFLVSDFDSCVALFGKLVLSYVTNGLFTSDFS